MDGFLRQATASQVRWIGPFLDDTDFKTAETALTVANTDIKVSKSGGASASKNSGGGTHDVNGMYAVTWDATDTATVGELKYSVKVAGALQVFGSYVVVEEVVYDALFVAAAPGFATVAALATLQGFVDTEVGAILAAVDTEVAAILALLDDPRGEPGQTAPPVNPDLATKVDFLYKAWRNKKTNDGTTTKLFADDAATVDQKQATSESAGTVTKGEWATGP